MFIGFVTVLMRPVLMRQSELAEISRLLSVGVVVFFARKICKIHMAGWTPGVACGCLMSGNPRVVSRPR
jgi:hypothetical protein